MAKAKKQPSQQKSPNKSEQQSPNNKQYAILAVNPGHNGSAALVINGNLVFYSEEERFSRMKYDGNPFRVMLTALLNFKIDELVIGGSVSDLPKLPWTGENPYTALVRKFNPNVKVTDMTSGHHMGHAASAFYGSGFETAVAVVVDGCGSLTHATVDGKAISSGYETESVYACAYPAKFEAIYKRYSDGFNPYHNDGVHEWDGACTIVKAYEAVSQYLGFGPIEAGKTMGLAPYGKEDNNVPMFFIDGKGNKNLILPRYPAGAYIDDDRYPYLTISHEDKVSGSREWHKDFSLVRDVDKNIAYAVQQETEEEVIKLIQKAIDATGETNVVLSGGYALNCVANYKIVKAFPNIKFWVDPIAHDGGTAIGLAKLVWHIRTEDTTIRKLDSLYLSAVPQYSNMGLVEEQLSELLKFDEVTPEDISRLIEDGNIVTMFQGKAEGGPRALGNRSILFDPRRPDGKDIVNSVKHREWFRPFAGSVLQEHAAEWFDMAGLESSPFMMYAVDVLPDKVDLIPAVTHVDNTCRVQTVSTEDNPNYYALICAFYKSTGVPVLFNTSLNLGGEPLVESIDDAINIILHSDMKYLYLPDINKLVTRK
jgi:carbamoyltransferase